MIQFKSIHRHPTYWMKNHDGGDVKIKFLDYIFLVRDDQQELAEMIRNDRHFKSKEITEVPFRAPKQQPSAPVAPEAPAPAEAEDTPAEASGPLSAMYPPVPEVPSDAVHHRTEEAVKDAAESGQTETPEGANWRAEDPETVKKMAAESKASQSPAPKGQEQVKHSESKKKKKKS